MAVGGTLLVVSVYRVAVLVALLVAVAAGAVAVVAGAVGSVGQGCETFPDARGRGVHAVCGPILEAYRGVYGPDGALGLPESDEHDVEPSIYQHPGHRQMMFDWGVIDLDVATGRTSVYRGFGFVPNT